MVTQRLLSLAESLCKNGSLLSDGHCTFSPLCWSLTKASARRTMEQWLGCQEALQWSRRPSAFAKRSAHFMLVCWWCQRATPLCSGCHAGCWGPLSWIQNCLAAVLCATRTSVSCLSQMTAVLPVTCENLQKGTHKGLISAKGVRSWLLDIHVLCQDVWLWEDLAKDS